jgi:menaquinone-dependent protoporphyrinogen IX oxidase
VNLEKARTIDLNQYDSVIIGGSVMMGRIRKEVKQFWYRGRFSVPSIWEHKRSSLFFLS